MQTTSNYCLTPLPIRVFSIVIMACLGLSGCFDKEPERFAIRGQTYELAEKPIRLVEPSMLNFIGPSRAEDRRGVADWLARVPAPLQIDSIEFAWSECAVAARIKIKNEFLYLVRQGSGKWALADGVVLINDADESRTNGSELKRVS